MNMSDDLKESRDIFLTESGDYLELLNSELLKLERIADRDIESASLNNMFRAAHSIKGMSAMMGYDKVNRLTHKMENILDNIRQGNQKFSNEIVEMLFECFDLLTALISAVSQNEKDDDAVDIEGAIRKIEGLIKASAAGKSGSEVNISLSISKEVKESLRDFDDLKLFIAGRSQENVFEIVLRFDRDNYPDHLNPAAFFDTLKEKGEIVHMTPDPGSISDITNILREKPDFKILAVYQTAETYENVSRLSDGGLISVRDLREPLPDHLTAGCKEEDKIEPPSYLNVFIEESYEEIEKMNEALLELERNPLDFENLNAVMRGMHNIKSSSASVGFGNISSLAHTVESLLGTFEKSKNAATGEAIDLLLGSIDGIRNFLALAMEGRGHEMDFSENINVFKQLIGSYGVSDANAGNGEFRLNEYGPVLLDGEFEPVKKAHRVDMAVKETAAAKSAPDPSAKKNGKSSSSNTAPESGNGGDPQNSQTLRVDMFKLDKLINLIGELVIIKANFFQISGQLNKIFSNKQLLYDLEDMVFDHERKKDELANEFTEIEKLGKNLYGRQISQKNDGRQSRCENNAGVSVLLSALEAGNQSNMSYFEDAVTSLRSANIDMKEHFRSESYIADFNSATYKLGNIINSLQKGIMETRMVPAGTLFKRFLRVVRDLAKQQNKRVNLHIHGEETELDKKVIDELGNPLTHIIRNSVDHAIESREERLALNKSEEGNIYLNAYHEGSNICIDVTDDGRGIKSEKVLKKAVEKGLVTESTAAGLTRQEIMGLIFMPGFSTADNITDISGRGVGMDIVKKTLENLKGTVAISSEEDRGTKIMIRLPLTLAIISALLVKISDSIFTIPLESVIEITKIVTRDIHTVEVTKTIKLRDKIISILELSDAIGVSPRTKAEDHVTVVVVASADNVIGICVDELIGKEEVVIKSLADDFKKVEGVSGASVLGDGTVSLILDVPAIVRRVRNAR